MQKIKGVMTWPEKKVARALSEAGFLWKYEWEAVLDHGNGYESVRYPDFYLPEADIYIEVLSINPSEESMDRFKKKLDFYDKNGLDYIVLDLRKNDREYKTISELREEIEEEVYERAFKKNLPYYSEKRFIDDFLVSRDGYRKRSDYSTVVDVMD